MTNNYKIEAQNLLKAYGSRLIFKELSFCFESNGIYGIAGSNGSGKSTLVKIICNIISPTKGKITHQIDNKTIEMEQLHAYIGFVSPYLVLYEEFSAYENMQIFAEIRDIKFNEEEIKSYFEDFLLYQRRDDLVKGYSSGMKQRLKYIAAMMHHPNLLVFDEPTSNLDEEGKNTVFKIIERVSKNAIVILASNETSDLEFCSSVIPLMEYKK